MDCRRIWPHLAASMAGRLSFNASLKEHCSFGIGGPARILVRPDRPEELVRLLAACRDEGLNYFVLGAGSNVLFADSGFDGMVIKLGSGFKTIERLSQTELRAGAAVSGPTLLKSALEAGLSGLEGLAGIPCSLGGALIMNAGSYGRDMGPVVAGIDYLDSDGREGHLGPESLKFAYRRLEGLPPGAIILGARLKLNPEAPEAIKARVDEALKQRAEKQPKGLRSAGSVFKNPAGQSAGRLIDAAGLKGRQTGGAEVSDVHANFIVNLGGATSSDVVELMRVVVETVKAKYDITLEPEIKLVGQEGEGAHE